MARYIQFTAADGGTILLEVEEEEVTTQKGVVKAGLKDKVQEAVVQAQATFEEAMMETVRRNAQAFIQKLRALPDPPQEAEITFGLKGTGEAGNAAVAKAGAEANYTVKLVWKQAEAGEVSAEK
jgi:predicted methyltransferase